MKITTVDDCHDDEVKILIQLSNKDFIAIANFDEADRELLREYELSPCIADRLLAIELIARRLEQSDGDILFTKLRRKK